MPDAVDLGEYTQPSEELTPSTEGFSPSEVPVKIHHTNGRTFIVDKIGAWGYLEAGIFATGNWSGYSGEIDVIIPYNRVEYYELDYKRLKKYIADYAAAQEARDESTSA